MLFTLFFFTLTTVSIPDLIHAFIHSELQASASYTITSTKFLCSLDTLFISLFTAVNSPSFFEELSIPGRMVLKYLFSLLTECYQ